MRGLTGIITSFFLAVGIAAAGYFISQTMINARTGVNTASVKGLSERIVDADTGRWTLTFKRAERDTNLVAETFAALEQDKLRIQEVLTKAGFSAEEMRFAPMIKNNQEERDYEGNVVDRYYTVDSSVQIYTRSPEKIEPSRQPIFSLTTDGIQIRESSLSYDFTGLNEIKPDMLREATENARIAANEFASNAGINVGGIQLASQGGFSIQSADDGSAGLRKLVRVVTNITFYLDNK